MANEAGAADAEEIFRRGWSQGSVFIPSPTMLTETQGLAGFNPDTECLVVLTQACSVVSSRFAVDPFIEVAVGRRLDRFNPNAAEATGKNVRKIQLALRDQRSAPAIECDINRRYFIPRRGFVGFAPDDIVVDVLKLSGWIARYYNRIALPNELVARAKRTLFPNLEAVLRSRRDDVSLSDLLNAIYINWMPKVEQSAGEIYEIDLLFLTNGIALIDVIKDALNPALAGFDRAVEHDGLIVVWEVQEHASTTLGALAGFQRLTDWDHLSDLGFAAAEQDKSGAD